MFDRRTPLGSGAVLHLGGVDYRINELIGRGSNAMVYSASYEDNLSRNLYHSVLIKELFPLHDEGLIFRDASGRVQAEPKAAEFFDLHRQSFVRGNAVNLTLQELRANQVSLNINSFEAHGTLYSVLGDSDGLTLEKANAQNTLRTLKDVTECVLNILDSLKLFHHNNLLHLDVSPDNILMLRKDPKKSEQFRKMMLIDYNSVFPMEELTGSAGIYYSIKEPYSAPEVIMRNTRSISPATDLFSICAIFFEYVAENKFTSSVQMLEQSKSFRGNGGLLKSVPATVRQKTIAIIRRGLALSPARRYQSIEQMESDLLELHGRIEGIGVTHSSLWEASALQFKAMLSSNPQLAYLAGNDIPSQLSAKGIGANTVLLGGGGIGKTTALLRMWQSGIESYDPKAPVPLYVKLSDYSREKSIRLRCLDRLRFSEETATVEDALKVLDDIFDKPNSVLFLLDGFNEAADNQREALLSEIRDLSRLGGVKIVMTSRTGAALLKEFHSEEIQPLSEGFVQDYLNSNRLLYPSAGALRELITNPMMLTMYAAVAGSSSAYGDAFDESALMKAYLDYVVSKASIPVAADFAVKVLLPRIAAVMARQKTHAISAAQLLECVEQIYKALKGRHFYKEFHEYIGESALLVAEANNADEWFNATISKLLGRELALLIKTESGQYTFAHQLYRDYFAGAGVDVGKRLRKAAVRRRAPQAILAAAAAAVLFFGIWGVIGSNRAVFPRTQEEINAVNDAVSVIQIATVNFSLALSDGEWAIDEFKRPSLSGDWSMFSAELERRQTTAAQFYVVTPSSIERYTSAINIPGNTIPIDAYRELCNFSSDFIMERDLLLDGIFGKVLLTDDSARLQSLFDNYAAWSENRAVEYVLLLRRAISPLPDEYQQNVLEISGLGQTLLRHMRDDQWAPERFDSDLQATREINDAILSKFRMEGVMSK